MAWNGVTEALAADHKRLFTVRRLAALKNRPYVCEETNGKRIEGIIQQ